MTDTTERDLARVDRIESAFLALDSQHTDDVVWLCAQMRCKILVPASPAVVREEEMPEEVAGQVKFARNEVQKDFARPFDRAIVYLADRNTKLEQALREKDIATAEAMALVLEYEERIARFPAQVDEAVKREREAFRKELRKRMRSADDAIRFPWDRGHNAALNGLGVWLDRCTPSRSENDR